MVVNAGPGTAYWAVPGSPNKHTNPEQEPAVAERLPRISGTIHHAGGTVQFQITEDGYHQWGADNLGATVDLLTRLESSAREAGFFVPDEEPAPEDEEEPEFLTAEALAAAARECILHHHGLGIPDGCPIALILPVGVMPSPDLFRLVYEVTGQSEEDRLARVEGRFRPDGFTESGWARMMLRRWAITTLPANHLY